MTMVMFIDANYLLKARSLQKKKHIQIRRIQSTVGHIERMIQFPLDRICIAILIHYNK